MLGGMFYVIGNHGRCLSRGGTCLEGGCLEGIGRQVWLLSWSQGFIGEALKEEVHPLPGPSGIPTRPPPPPPGTSPSGAWRGAMDLESKDLVSRSDPAVDPCILE